MMIEILLALVHIHRRRLSLVLLTMIAALMVVGCDQNPASSVKDDRTIDRAQLGEMVRHLAAAQDSLFALPDAEAPAAQDVRDYWVYRQALKNPDTRLAALDSIWVRWDRDPESFVWTELAILRKQYFEDNERLDQAFARASGTDTTRAIARWVYGRGRMNRRRHRLMYMYTVEDAPGARTEVQAAWLQLALGRTEQMLGDPSAAAERMASLLTRAWDAGGLPLASYVWHDLSMYCRLLGRLDDALFAARMAGECARRDGHAILTIRAELVAGAAHEARCEFTPAAKSYLEAEQLATDNGYLKWIHDSLQFTVRANRAQGDWRTCIENQRRALALSVTTADTFMAIQSSLAIGDAYRFLGEIDSTRAWYGRARSLNHVSRRWRQDTYIAVCELELLLQLGQYDRADSLRATMSDQLTEVVAFDLLLGLVEQGMETGRPDLVYQGLAEARTMDQALVKTGRYDPVLHVAQLAAVFHARMGEFPQADAELDAARARIEAGATEFARWDQAICRGQVAELAGDLDGAEAAFAEALERSLVLDTRDLEHRSRIRLGHVLLQLERFEEARELLTATADIEEYWPRLSARLFLGMVENRAGRPQEALDQLAMAGRLIHDDAPRDLVHRLHLERGQSLAALGRPDEAFDSYRSLDLTPPAVDGAQLDNELLRALNRPYHMEYAEAVIDLLVSHPRLSGVGDLARETLVLAETARLWSDTSALQLSARDLEAVTVPEGAVVVAHFIGRSNAFAWTGTPDGWAVRRIADHDRLGDLVEHTLIDMESPARAVQWTHARELARVLLGEAETAWRVGSPLFVIPTGRLSSIPWPALPLEDDDPAGGAMFLDHGPVVHLAGLASLQSTGEQVLLDEARLLALGVDGDGSDHRLRHAESEARAIAALWPAGQVDLRCGARANWSAVAEANLEAIDVIHLATHASITQGSPGHSSLRLAGREGRPLTIPEIERLGVEAELVFLSSCEGARSTTGQTGGLDSFVHAFLNGGTGSVVASSQPVDDRAARFLAERFYAHWWDGKSKAAALRSALLDLRGASEDWIHPFYWGHYQLHMARR